MLEGKFLVASSKEQRNKKYIPIELTVNGNLRYSLTKAEYFEAKLYQKMHFPPEVSFLEKYFLIIVAGINIVLLIDLFNINRFVKPIPLAPSKLTP